ncbi:MAG: hypothetical protein QOG73_1426, partial [Acetobacteraceae bacterium]|nr:hypothetical protein [Acetobacteraceae bacterium]
RREPCLQRRNVDLRRLRTCHLFGECRGKFGFAASGGLALVELLSQPRA